MSKIGKQSIKIPKEVSISLGDVIKIKGSKGEFEMEKPQGFGFDLSEGVLNIVPGAEVLNTKKVKSMWGLYRSLLNNMVLGVLNGFEKSLEFKGVGFKASVKGSDLELNVGFSHSVVVKAPEGINFKVEKNKITVSGFDKQKVGQVASNIRAVRPPEPYKGTGIKYENEIIRRKAGKKAIAVTG